MAEITTKKRSRIVTLSEHWNYTQTAITNNFKRHSIKTSFDLQKDLMHDVVHISLSTVRRLVEAGRKDKKRLNCFLLKKWKQKFRMCRKINISL